jgi:SAM-dependent methyltransferase
MGRGALTPRYADNPKVTVLTPDEAAALPAETFDLIVLPSVAQYLTGGGLGGLMATFRRLLKPTGVFVLGDVIPPRLAAPFAALALLRFGAANGFFLAAVFGLMRIFVSDYFKLKKTHGLSHYEEEAILDKFKRAGFAATRAAHNIGHNQRRMTFLARRA